MEKPQIYKELRKREHDLSQGEFLSKLRNEKKMTKEDLAYQMEVSVKTITNWENNKPINSDHLAKLLKILEITYEEFCQRKLLIDTMMSPELWSKRLLEYTEALNPGEIWQELMPLKKMYEERYKRIDACLNKDSNENTIETDVIGIIELAWKNNPEGCFEFLKETSYESFNNEKEFAEKYYSNPDDFDPEVGLDVALMDEDTLKEAILMIINDCQSSEENGIQTHFEETEKLLGSGELSDTEIESIKKDLTKTVKKLENQEITLSAQDMEKLFGEDLALSNFLRSLDE